jgi:formate hydrogenlyase subunit 6/NADH:ubiquinone oxidoreductase subunit I
MCPAGVCKALFHYEIDAEACTGCTLCAKKCPQEAIAGKRKSLMAGSGQMHQMRHLLRWL